MKILIALVLILPTLSFANFIDESSIGKCSGYTVYSSQAEGRIKIPKDYNCEYFDLIEEKTKKAQTESCSDEIDCQNRLEKIVCEKGKAIKNLDSQEVYCSWVEPKHVSMNGAKKLEFDSKIALKEIEKDNKKKEKTKLINDISNSSVDKKIKDALLFLLDSK